MQPKDQDAISKVDGEECIILSVNKQSGSNTAQIAELAKAEFDPCLRATIPCSGISLWISPTIST
mgnify:CR=1 FL=1